MQYILNGYITIHTRAVCHLIKDVSIRGNPNKVDHIFNDKTQ